jgi:hypothetical protein
MIDEDGIISENCVDMQEEEVPVPITFPIIMVEYEVSFMSVLMKRLRKFVCHICLM